MASFSLLTPGLSGTCYFVPRDATTAVLTPCVDATRRKHEEMSTRRRSPRLALPSSAERDDSPSEASSAPDHVDFRCQETATRRQSAPLPVVLVGHAQDTCRAAIVDMVSVPKTAGFHDVVEVIMSAAREEKHEIESPGWDSTVARNCGSPCTAT